MWKDLITYFKILKKYTAGQGPYIFAGVILALMTQICGLATPFLTRFLVDNIIGQKNYPLLLWFLLFCLVVLLILFATSLTSNYILIRVFEKSGVKFHMEIFRKLQQAPLEFFSHTPTGEISYRLLQDSSTIENSWQAILVTLPLQIILLMSGIFMVVWNIHLALFVFLILAIQILVIVKFREPLLRYSLLIKQRNQEVTGYAVEHFQKIQLIRSLSTEKKEQLAFHRKLHKLVITAVRSLMLGQFSGVTVSVLNNLWVFGILWYGGGLVIAGEMTLGTLMAFMLFANILYQPISALTNFILSFQGIRASLKRLLEYINIKPKVIESPEAVEYVPKQGRITFKNVSFGYNSRPILKQVNLEIPSNIIFALVGKSGVGKTTLCRLLVRFYDPQIGTICLDNKNIKDITLASLRRTVLLMLQNDYVFSATIWDNITYGLKSITKKDVIKAAQDASLDFINILPEGFETKIGGGGINFSVGETQRIALARAFLMAPKVLILDEPTSFIDSETEGKIIQSLLRLKEKCTIILIAHRLSTVKIADQIGVMKDGTIAEIGSHSELMEKKDGIYRKVYLSILSK
jgi:ATP-binding cassette subfamily B protein